MNIRVAQAGLRAPEEPQHDQRHIRERTAITVSVIIAAFTTERWLALQDAVESVCLQSARPLETIVVIDHNPELLAQARRELTGVQVIPNLHQAGASGARNTGVSASHGEVVAFLDDDAIASPQWLETLLHQFANPDVVGAGGRLEPLWAASRPRWFPPEFDWTVGVSYKGMPETTKAVRNVWSTNMAIRRLVFDAAGGFRNDFGKVKSLSRPEDTDLCLRAANSQAHGYWVYEPTAIASHRVPSERATLRYFLYRCFNEGWGKAELAGLNGLGQSTSAERSYACRLLPTAFAAGWRQTAHGDLSGSLRATAIAVGLYVTALGFIVAQTAILIGARRQRSGQAPKDAAISNTT
jgi:GT2 family glycosyltransferase